ncbi:hypothetical protein CRYUN_Cryun06bG0114000 [Craigia yunnanensis]
MSFKNRSPPSPQPQDLKQRVITCLNKLANRDTLAFASAELESIARNLTADQSVRFLTASTTPTLRPSLLFVGNA